MNFANNDKEEISKMRDEINKILEQYIQSLPTYSEHYENMPSENRIFFFRCFINSISFDNDNILYIKDMKSRLGMLLEYYQSGQIITQEFFTFIFLLYYLQSDNDKQITKQNIINNIESHKQCVGKFSSQEYDEILESYNMLFMSNVYEEIEKMESFKYRRFNKYYTMNQYNTFDEDAPF